MNETTQIEAAAQRLRDGGLVAFPTETVYGLGADAGNESAVAAIYAVKGRPANHPLIVHIADHNAALYWIGHNDLSAARRRFDRLAARFWPGPLTLIMRRSEQAPGWACGGQASIGLRCPAHPIAQGLLQAFSRYGRGIAAPSANRYGRISPTTAQHVRDEFSGDAPILLLDGGAARHGLESTIIDLSREQAVLLRPGAISADEVAAGLGESVAISSNVIDPDQIDRQAPRASGTLASHYAPRNPMYIVSSIDLHEKVRVHEQAGKRVLVLPCADSLVGYAHHLYARLRELDEQAGAITGAIILVEAPPREPQWQAVWDRLLRAQTKS